jgi:protoporphyrinogen oxidase
LNRRKPHIVILGAGPAGLGAAFHLTRRGLADVTVLEGSDRIGGMAGSFDISGVRVDYGSHRLHPSCDEEILQDINTLLGDDLLDRPRHGRIRLRDRWIHFPLKPVHLILKLPLDFSVGAVLDLMLSTLRRESENSSSESFASVLVAGLGKTICREFYFPYAQKIWGLPPDELSPTQAHRRVSAGSGGKIFLKILSAIPLLRPSESGRFFYPRDGFGQISECLAQAAKENGTIFQLNTEIESIRVSGRHTFAIYCRQNGKIATYQPDHFWSTIPMNDLIQYMEPAPPTSVMQVADKINFRSMILIYLLLEEDRFSEYDAHYFPQSDIRITRLSEPKNYSNASEPRGRTVLCAELPCSTTDPEWQLSDEDLGKLLLHSLRAVGLPINSDIKTITTRRLRQAYPIYRRGYEDYFDIIDQWLGRFQNLISFGRQGLFVHDNIHHTLFMAYSAAKCFYGNGYFDRTQWQTFRRVFDTHVVED